MYLSTSGMMKFFQKIVKYRQSHHMLRFDEKLRLLDSKISSMLKDIEGIEDGYIGTRLQGYLTYMQKELSSYSERLDDNVLTVYILCNDEHVLSLINLVIKTNFPSIRLMPYDDESVTNADGILYFIDQETLYFKRNDQLNNWLKRKPSIGILDVPETEEIKRDMEHHFDQNFSSIIYDFKGQRDVLNEHIEKYLLKSSEESRLFRQQQSLNNFVKWIREDTDKLIQELRESDQNRLLDKSTTKQNHTNHVSDFENQLDWVISKYEITIKENLRLEIGGVWNSSNKRAFIEEQILNVETLKRDIEKLMNTIVVKLSKSQMSIELSAPWESLEIFHLVELNLIINELNEKSLFNAFTRKKKQANLSNSLQNFVDQSMKTFKEQMVDYFSKAAKQDYQSIFDSIDNSFQEKYCKPEHLISIIRLLNTFSNQINDEVVDLSLVDIILGKWNEG